MTTTTIHDLSGELQTAVPRGDDATVELTLGAVRDLLGRLERLEQLEKQAGCDACQGQIDALAARVAEHDDVLDAGTVSDLQHLLTTLRANGVTRYQRGDVAIELRPPSLDRPPAEPIGAAEQLWQLLDDIDTTDDACRDNDGAFRQLARDLIKRRHRIAACRDGHSLEWQPAKHSMDWMSTGQGLADDDTPEQPLTASGVVLPSLDELRQESDTRRRQQEEDRSGVGVERAVARGFVR